MFTQVANHLWQSTVYAAGIAILAVALHRRSAKCRYWLWFSALLKFLVPFAVLENIGRQLGALGLLHVSSGTVQKILPTVTAIQFGSAPASHFNVPHDNWDGLLAIVWVTGLTILLFLWGMRWRWLYKISREAVETRILADVVVRLSSSNLEPGVIGIVSPAIVFPFAILARLTKPELAALLEHEKAHLDRQDNLMALLQMTVEATFWFYPPVWWIGERLLHEREEACDQRVLAAGHRPQIYAEGILKVCSFCLGSRIACAAGASGSRLAQRIEKIAGGQADVPVGKFQRAALAIVASIVFLGPICAGLITPEKATAILARLSANPLPLRPPTALEPPQLPAPRPTYRVRRYLRYVMPVQVSLRRDIRLGDLIPKPTPLPMLPMTEKASDRTGLATGGSAEASVHEASQGDASQKYSRLAETIEDNPVGGGDPAAITCRKPQSLPGSRLLGPTICAPNSRWTSLAHQQLHYSAAGEIESVNVETPPAEEGIHLTYVNCGAVANNSAATSPGCTLGPWAAIRYY